MINLENSKKCPNCGTRNNIISLYCSTCGKQLDKKNIINNTQNIINTNKNIINDKKGNILAIISFIICYIGISYVPFISTELTENNSIIIFICPLLGIVLMIFGRIKYPNNIYLKILMWLIIAGIIFHLMIYIFVTTFCSDLINASKAGGSGCG